MTSEDLLDAYLGFFFKSKYKRRHKLSLIRTCVNKETGQFSQLSHFATLIVLRQQTFGGIPARVILPCLPDSSIYQPSQMAATEYHQLGIYRTDL